MAQLLAKLPKVRSKWPSEAKLVKATDFSLMDGEKIVGVINLNAGTRIKIVEIKLEHVIVRIGATESPVPVMQTDIIERMGGAAKILALPNDPEAPKPAPATTK